LSVILLCRRETNPTGSDSAVDCKSLYGNTLVPTAWFKRFLVVSSRTSDSGSNRVPTHSFLSWSLELDAMDIVTASFLDRALVFVSSSVFVSTLLIGRVLDCGKKKLRFSQTLVVTFHARCTCSVGLLLKNPIRPQSCTQRLSSERSCTLCHLLFPYTCTSSFVSIATKPKPNFGSCGGQSEKRFILRGLGTPIHARITSDQ
jgi:hypothetical protein